MLLYLLLVGFSVCNVIQEWNEIEIVVWEKSASAFPFVVHHAALRAWAVEVALDSLNCKNSGPICTEEIANLTVAYASAYVLKYFYGRTNGIWLYLETLMRAKNNNKAIGVVETAKSKGEDAAKKILEKWAGDGAAGYIDYVPSTDPTKWKPCPANVAAGLTTMLFAQWQDVDPLIIPRPGSFPVPPAPSVYSLQFKNDHNYTYHYGGLNSLTYTTLRTADQSNAAIFHDGITNQPTQTFLGNFNRVAAIIWERASFGFYNAAILASLMTRAVRDAFLSNTWNKARYDGIRPVTAIRDVNGTFAAKNITTDPNWLPYIPQQCGWEYPAGHATGTAAAMTILRSVFPTSITEVPFFLPSDYPLVPGRTFTGLNHFQDEAALARIWGGMHYNFSCTVGRQNGKDVAEYIYRKLCFLNNCFSF